MDKRSQDDAIISGDLPYVVVANAHPTVDAIYCVCRLLHPIREMTYQSVRQEVAEGRCELLPASSVADSAPVQKAKPGPMDTAIEAFELYVQGRGLSAIAEALHLNRKGVSDALVQATVHLADSGRLPRIVPSWLDFLAEFSTEAEAVDLMRSDWSRYCEIFIFDRCRVLATSELLRNRRGVRGAANGIDGRRAPPPLEEYLGLDPNSVERYRRAYANFRSWLKFRCGGMSPDDFVRFLEIQRGVCAICGHPPDRKINREKGRGFHFDHDHSTNQLRGLLCSACNRALGLFGDDVDVLNKAIGYLQNPPCKQVGRVFVRTFNRDMEQNDGLPSPRQQMREEMPPLKATGRDENV